MTDETTLKLARIMIVDDEDAVVRRITEVLQAAEYENVVGTSNPVEAVTLFVKVEPDLLILDLEMPQLDGFGVIERIRPFIEEGADRPILALAGNDASAALKRRSISAGARDLVLKPVEDTELLARVRNLIEIRLLNLLLAGDGQRIEFLADDVARMRTRALEDVQRELLTRLAMTGEFKGTINIEHPEGVSLLSSILAKAMGMPDDQADLIGRAALVHDLGKIGIPEEVWAKPAPLTPEEYEHVKTHTEIGSAILAEGRSPLLWLAEEIAGTHHERWDGEGYLGMKGQEIPLASRIVAVADAYEALTHNRPHRSALPADEAVEEIKRQAGKQFDPAIVEAFLKGRGE